MGSSCIHHGQKVPQTWKLPQHKPKLMSLQLVAQMGIESVSSAHQNLALIYLHGQPSNLGLKGRYLPLMPSCSE
eukprot:10400028-Ditylum_brightwellii.AAC.1